MARRYEHDADYTKIMQTPRWRRARAEQLTARPLCERCEEAGIMTPATEVHHRQPIERAGDLAEKVRRAFDASNLMSVCSACHDAIHAELNSHSAASIAATARAETDAMIAALFHAGGDL